jgi:uncharacterized membrane protein YidH (DUF202 family)
LFEKLITANGAGDELYRQYIKEMHCVHRKVDYRTGAIMLILAVILIVKAIVNAVLSLIFVFKK